MKSIVISGKRRGEGVCWPMASTGLSSRYAPIEPLTGLAPAGFHPMTRKGRGGPTARRDADCWCRPRTHVRSPPAPPFASVPALHTGFEGQRVASGKLRQANGGRRHLLLSSRSADPHSPGFTSPPVPVDLQVPGARLAATGEGGSGCDRTQPHSCAWVARREGALRAPRFLWSRCDMLAQVHHV